MLHYYVDKNSQILLVDDAKIELDNHDKELDLIFEYCRLTDVMHLGGGIYDAIIFPTRPPIGILGKAIEKIYWGGIIIIQGIEHIVKESGYQVLKGDPDMLVLRRPPAPDNWSEEYYLQFQERGRAWNAETKEFHPAYRKKFIEIDFDWENATVVELGCGRGEITRLMARAGAKRVYALDSSPAAAVLTKNFCRDCGNVEAVYADALKWESPEKADIIVALDFVEHIEEIDLPTLFRRMHENLKDGGIVHILTPAGPDHVRDHRWHPTPKTLREKMESVGFRELWHKRPRDSRKFLARFVK